MNTALAAEVNSSSEIKAYDQRRQRLIGELAAARANGVTVGLAKTTSNLFRHRIQQGTKRIDVRQFHHVLHVDAGSRVADVEGMTTYEELADETLKFGLLPTVVPQLKTITIGGAVSGIGIESSSFKYGLVHETSEEMEVLLGDAEPGPVLRLPELLRHTRLRAAAEGEAHPCEEVCQAHAHQVHRAHEILRADRSTLRELPLRLHRRRGLQPRGDVHHHRRVYRRCALRQRLHLHESVLPVHTAARGGLPHRQGLHLALGHRLVLVLEA